MAERAVYGGLNPRSRPHRSGFAALLALALASGVFGCARPPVLTPLRLADRGPAPLARTAELRISASAYFEQRRDSSGHKPVRFRIGEADLVPRPNTFITYAFTDSLALVVPGAVLWSPVLESDQGVWLTLGGGVYGFGFGDSGFTMTNGAGAWLKRRFGTAFWLTGALVTRHYYFSSLESDDPDDEPSSRHHFLFLSPGIEGGVQLTDTCAVMLLAEQSLPLSAGGSGNSHIRAELVLTHSWWLDIGLSGGIFVQPQDSLHVDPAVSLTVTARW